MPRPRLCRLADGLAALPKPCGVLAANDVVRALDFIRRNACRTGFTTDDVAKFMGGSRRLALQQFKSAVGHTILEEIHDHRLAEAQRLLADTDLSIETIANRCGYATPAFLARLFKSSFGQTIRDWRKGHQIVPEFADGGFR